MSVGDLGSLWFVTLTVSGDPVPAEVARAALQRLAHERPFFVALRYRSDRAELQYWEEAGSLLEAASLAVRLWAQHRVSAALPPWRVVGVEVLDRETHLGRAPGTGPILVGARQVSPF